MHKTRKKMKTEKVPKPIKIKKEKTEEDRTLHSMEHYIDDRLELIKQIFGTLKPKTITNLAPDFLKNKGMEEIEEMCLNEILCISTKRLRSIINATKCPTDTDTSSDSDVEHQEEHISLEEISSDSEIEGANSKTTKSKATGNNAKQDGKKTAEKNGSADGQISVLELLELQARARAIRSQLAMEPVTKIEVHSDDEQKAKGNIVNSDETQTTTKHNSRKRKKEKSKEKNAQGSSKDLTANSTSATNGALESNAKRTEKDYKDASVDVKKKRNFRTRQISESNAQTKNNNDIKEEKVSRSNTPDVIPIIHEPETLLISDNSDAEMENSAKPSKTAAIDKTNMAAEKESDLLTTAQNDEEVEDGELTESEVEKNTDIVANTNQIVETRINDDSSKDKNTLPEKSLVNSDSNQDAQNEVKKNKRKSEDEVSKQSKRRLSKSNTVSESSTDSSNDANDNKTAEDAPIANESNKQMDSLNANKNGRESITEESDEDDDQNDDVISIEGGDLETEMIEHLENAGDTDTKSLFSTLTKVKEELEVANRQQDDTNAQDDADIISLESSDDERNKDTDQSWRARYLNSSKVSKVLATSRLGKRVRDKVKKSNHDKKNADEAKDNEASKSNAFVSQHEDGSVEQYNELLKIRQRKT